MVVQHMSPKTIVALTHKEARLTLKAFLKGKGYSIEREYEWHRWEMELPRPCWSVWVIVRNIYNLLYLKMLGIQIFDDGEVMIVCHLEDTYQEERNG